MKNFISLGSYAANGMPCYSVENPEECQDFDHILGICRIDGVYRMVLNVERFAHMPPVRK